METFLYGASAMGCTGVGLFFFRFWRRSFDRLFLLFALAFWLLALDRTVLGLVSFATEWRPYVFFIRLGAFALIIYAIVEKNRR
jgi:hypothetical protein